MTPEEAKRLETDIIFATEKLNETKHNKYDDNSVKNIGIESSSRDQNEEVGAFKWPHEAILLLIEEYKLKQTDFTSGKSSQRKIWASIAEEMKKHGHDVTGPQCLSKFSGLKRTYKSIKDNNKKSGSGARMWPYFSNMDELLHSKPYMSPLTTLSSTGKRTEKSSEFNSISDTCNDVAGPSSSRVNLDDEKPVHSTTGRSLLTTLQLITSHTHSA